MSLAPRESFALAVTLWAFAPAVAQELTEALLVYRGLCQRRGRPVGAGLVGLSDDLASMNGRGRTERTETERARSGLGENGLMSTQEVARVLGVSARTVRRRINDGELPSVRVGRPHRVRPEDLIAYIEANRS